MSQHVKKLKGAKGQSYTIITGWDRPCQGFFLLVTVQLLPTSLSNEYDTVYTNMTEAVPHPKDFTFFENILTDLKLTLPKDMRAALEEDKMVDRGNHFVDWDEQ